MECDDKVGDAEGFRNDEDYGSVDMVTGRVCAVGFVGPDMKIFGVSLDRSQRDEAIEEGATRGGRAVFWRRSGEGAHTRSDEGVGRKRDGRRRRLRGGEDSNWAEARRKEMAEMRMVLELEKRWRWLGGLSPRGIGRGDAPWRLVWAWQFNRPNW